MALDMDALGSSLFWWEIGGYIATAIVVIGVVGELIVEFTDWIKSPQTISRVGIASALILVIGLAGEILTQVRVNSISGQIIAFLNNDTASLRLELAKIQLPRNLSDEAQKRIADKIRPLGKQKYSLEEGPIEADSKIDAQLIDTLTLAGWEKLPAPDWMIKSRDPRVSFVLSDVFGVWVDFEGKEASRLSDVAKALAEALTTEGIEAHSRSVNDPRHRGPPDALAILIAPKR